MKNNWKLIMWSFVVCRLILVMAVAIMIYAIITWFGLLGGAGACLIAIGSYYIRAMEEHWEKNYVDKYLKNLND